MSASMQSSSSNAQPQAAQIPEVRAAGDRPTGAGVDTGAGSTRPKTEAERAADKQYEERMEEEYAKREGGA